MEYKNPLSEKNQQEAEAVYIRLAKSLLGHAYKAVNKRIYSISFTNNGRQLTETVCQVSPSNNEGVWAIIERDGICHTFTASRGVIEGSPMICKPDKITYFD